MENIHKIFHNSVKVCSGHMGRYLKYSIFFQIYFQDDKIIQLLIKKVEAPLMRRQIFDFLPIDFNWIFHQIKLKFQNEDLTH